MKNPLMVLDEIDKISTDYRGDTFSALLEVLDSEQNSHFRDHYVELPVDLSEVLFLTTANDIQTIPRPLLDRMEVIEISSYTENEKMHIAKDHLLPKQRERHGLKKEQFQISDKAMGILIRQYTREAGVRGLERRLAALCRKADREILEKGCRKVRVTERNLGKYLGKPLYDYQERNENDEIGIVRGLAWTSVGGDTLEIEVNLMPGKGNFELTGQLGDVMQESAKAGISYIRSIADGDGHALGYAGKTGEGRCGHDGRSDSQGTRTSGRRIERKTSGRKKRRHEKSYCAEKKPPGYRGIIQRDHGRPGTGLCRDDG